MDNILSNSGLIHIRDQIFGDFSCETLESCLRVSKHWNECLEDLFRLSLIKYLYEYGDNEIREYRTQSVITVRETIPGWNKAVEKYSEEASIEDLKEVKKSLALPMLGDCDEPRLWLVHLAAQCGRLKLMQFFFLSDYDFINDFDVIGNNTLHCACRSIEMIKLIVESSKELGIDLNARDSYGKTVFMYACSFGELDMMELMINSSKEFEIDLNARHTKAQRGFTEHFGNTAFIFACIRGQTEAVKLMIENRIEFGIDITKGDNRGKTPLECVYAFIVEGKQDLGEIRVILENEYSKDSELQLMPPVAKKRK